MFVLMFLAICFSNSLFCLPYCQLTFVLLELVCLLDQENFPVFKTIQLSLLVGSLFNSVVKGMHSPVLFIDVIEETLQHILVFEVETSIYN